MYSVAGIEKLNKAYLEIKQEYWTVLISSYPNLEITLVTDKSKEYLLQGFLRRFKIIYRCIKNIYTIYPPNKNSLLKEEELLDININLHSFVLNVFGCLDNLAWVLNEEKNMKLRREHVGLFSKEFQRNISDSFKSYLNNRSDCWYSNLKEFRDALAHRIPLYVPSANFTESDTVLFQELEKKKKKLLEEMFSVCKSNLSEKKRREKVDFLENTLNKITKKQRQLGKPSPIIAGFFDKKTKNRYIYLHGQIIADFRTVIEMLDKIKEELSTHHYDN